MLTKSSALNVNTIILGFHQGIFFFFRPTRGHEPHCGNRIMGCISCFCFQAREQDMSWKSSKEISRVKQSSPGLAHCTAPPGAVAQLQSNTGKSASLSFLVAGSVRHLPATHEAWVRSRGWEDALEKKMATHSSIPAWEIPWTESLVDYSPWGWKSWTQLKWRSTILLWIMPVANLNYSCELPFCLPPLGMKFLRALLLSINLKQWSIHSSMGCCLNIKKQ